MKQFATWESLLSIYELNQIMAQEESVIFFFFYVAFEGK